MSVDRAEEDRQHRDEVERRADREADHAPASEGYTGARFAVPGVHFVTEKRPGEGRWIARTEVGEWELGGTEAEAIGKLMVTLGERL